MGTIVRGTKSATGTTAFGASSTAKSSEVNTDFDTAYSEINGNIDNDNIKAAAAIANSKLNLSSISQNVLISGTTQITGTFTCANLNSTGILTSASLTCAALKLTSAQVLPITSILDEDDMNSNTTAALCTQQSIKAYVDSKGSSFVDRGDPAAADWTEATLTADSVYHDLDLSSIVPAGAKAVLLRLIAVNSAADSYIGFRENGNSNGWNASYSASQVANVNFGADIIVSLSSSAVIEYFIENSGTWTSIDLIVAGYWS